MANLKAAGFLGFEADLWDWGKGGDVGDVRGEGVVVGGGGKAIDKSGETAKGVFSVDESVTHSSSSFPFLRLSTKISLAPGNFLFPGRQGTPHGDTKREQNW